MTRVTAVEGGGRTAKRLLRIGPNVVPNGLQASLVAGFELGASLDYHIPSLGLGNLRLGQRRDKHGHPFRHVDVLGLGPDDERVREEFARVWSFLTVTNETGSSQLNEHCRVETRLTTWPGSP